MRSRKGFTLIELLVTMTITVILMMAIYGAINSAQRSTQGIERKVTAQQDARAALELIAMEIRMASYNPNFVTNIWVDPGNCFSTSGNQTYQGIQAATNNLITVEMDINENSVITNNTNTDPNETIAYVYDAANQYVTRTTNCGTAQPFLGETPASGRPRTVRVINDVNGNGVYDAGVDIPIFRYFDGNGVELTSFPANIPNIRRIDITLAVETAEIDPMTNQRRRLVYSTSVTPRNHVAN
ncbi:MAG: prepilin-type N-terminal cleavage/methylation domain-containing protein [Syntrophaceae bacterium]|nr:prepilin-type N-terminal cleavage/methylation domain-containing protein [Syntrophaceae bacterium]